MSVMITWLSYSYVFVLFLETIDVTQCKSKTTSFISSGQILIRQNLTKYKLLNVKENHY